MALWLDVTTILQWQWRPVGIIRVETEVAREFLLRSSRRFRFCRFDPQERSYREVSPEQLCQLPAFASLPVPWPIRLRRSLARALRRLPSPWRGSRLAAPRWSRRDTYLSLGLDWDDKDPALLLDWKRRFGFQVVLCCYDLIPVLFPQFTLASTRDRFPAYLRAMAHCADAVVCISHSTRNDLQAYLRAHGLPQPRLDVFHLGTDLPQPRLPQAVATPAVESVVQRGPFLLMVSTIEARKGHDVLYRAYRQLLARHDPQTVPPLVLVGMQGWGVEDLLATLDNDPLVADSIIRLSNLADSDVALLYQSCLFTVFPSQYEGWGLPVAESLARGKFCLASDRASLPEVGEAFCEYLDADDHSQWAERILFYCRNPQALSARERAIEQRYQPHSWRQTSQEILAVVKAL